MLTKGFLTTFFVKKMLRPIFIEVCWLPAVFFTVIVLNPVVSNLKRRHIAMRALTNFKFIKREKIIYNDRWLIMAIILTTYKSTCILKLRITDLLLLYVKNVNTGLPAFRNINLFLSLFLFSAGLLHIRMGLFHIRL